MQANLPHVEQASGLLAHANETIGPLSEQQTTDLLLDCFDWLEDADEAMNLAHAVAVHNSTHAHAVAHDYFFGVQV